MIYRVLSSHAGIIGIPIFRVNRHADTIYRHPADMDGFGTRLRHARKQRKLTQKQLAAASDIKQPSISDLETGETKEVSGPTLLAICVALRIRPEWLLWNRGSMEYTGRDLDLTPDELTLITKYRASSPTWRASLQSLAGIDRQQQDWLMENVLATVFQPAVPNAKVEKHLPPAPNAG